MKAEILGCKTGVAVSGGMDSMALLDLYVKNGQDLVVINVEHGIRGKTSLRDSEFVKNYCAERNIPFLGFSVNAPLYAKEKGVSVEVAARVLRYGIFRKLLDDGTVDRIALAHHADDNTETVLMRILRGTGIGGLQGIRDSAEFIRPLLSYSRAEIIAYVKENVLPYVEDESNFDSVYTRNFLRNEIIPLLKKRYPDLNASFARLAENAAEVENYLSTQIIPSFECEEGIFIPDVFACPDLIVKYSLNAALKNMGVYQDVERVHFNAVVGLKDKQNNAFLNLPYGVNVAKYNGGLLLYRPAKPFESIVFDGSEICSDGFIYRFFPSEKILKSCTADFDKLKGAVVRRKEEGDFFRKVNGKRKLLSDFLNERKLSVAAKDSLLVVADGKTVLAVLGLEVADEAKITSETKKIIHIIKEKQNL